MRRERDELSAIVLIDGRRLLALRHAGAGRFVSNDGIEEKNEEDGGDTTGRSVEERDGCERRDLHQRRLLTSSSNDTVKESQRSFLLNTLLCEGDHQSTGPSR